MSGWIVMLLLAGAVTLGLWRWVRRDMGLMQSLAAALRREQKKVALVQEVSRALLLRALDHPPALDEPPARLAGPDLEADHHQQPDDRYHAAEPIVESPERGEHAGRVRLEVVTDGQ